MNIFRKQKLKSPKEVKLISSHISFKMHKLAKNKENNSFDTNTGNSVKSKE